MGYEGLLALLRSCADEYQQGRDDERDNPTACPNDGEPLRDGPDGFLHCPFDGWRPAGAPTR
jgi:hypothetical protein